MNDTQFQDYIGRQRTMSWPFTADMLRKFAATMDMDPPKEGSDAPLGCQWIGSGEETPTSKLAEDGHTPKGGFLPPIELPARMWAGGVLDFKSGMRADDEVERRTTIVSVTPKSGKSGPLMFVELRHDYTCGGRDCLSEIQSLVFTQGRAKQATEPRRIDPGASWDETELVVPNAILLFRYSALTWNSHRIHYDADYCRDVEGYRGLVVHGPLMATLLLRHCEKRFGAGSLARFSFRGVSPAIADEPLRINSRKDGDKVALAIAGPGDVLVMQGEATLSGG